jgi:hypothetical protein
MARFDYEIELRDKAGDHVEWLDPTALTPTWRYNAVGGCAEATIPLKREFDSYGDIKADYEVQIWRKADAIYKPVSAGATLPTVTLGTPPVLSGPEWVKRELRWSGYILKPLPVLDMRERVTLQCFGYVRQLQQITVPNQTYNNLDVGAIVRSIFDNFVLGNTRIQTTDDLHLVESNIGIVAQSLQFDTSALNAIRTLAAIGGNAEWGVRADREFYFLPRSNSVKQTFVIPDRVKGYELIPEDSDQIVNRVYLRGGNGFEATLELSDPVAGHLKTRTALVPSISTVEDAALWGQAYAARFGAAQPSGRIRLGARTDWIEDVGHPLGRVRVMSGPTLMRLGETLPDVLPMLLGVTKGAATDYSFRPHSISYTPSKTGLDIDIDLGERGSAMSDLMEAIEFKLSEQAQAIGQLG